MMKTKDLFKTIVLDLDGVLTDTRKFHLMAWTKVMNGLLDKIPGQKPFTEFDYIQFVDGKPRHEGTISFLKSRNIQLSNDAIELLKTQKNDEYLHLIRNGTLVSYPEVTARLSQWKAEGICIVVASSSQNAGLILEKINVLELIDHVVDGHTGISLGLKGKPEPDFFLEALKRAESSPQDSVVVEDSISGLQAGSKANFRTVYAIDRKGGIDHSLFYKNGAHEVICDLNQIGHPLNALEHWNDFIAHIGNREINIFVDYDGTISEIVSHPDEATIINEAKQALLKLSQSCKVSVISGRDRLDVKKKVGLDNVFYAGNHGFDMSGPGCFHYQLDKLSDHLSSLNDASLAATNILCSIPGIFVERKQFATAIHYRNASESDSRIAVDRLNQLLTSYPLLRAKEGKKVIELVPDLDWGKGKAVRKLNELMNANSSSVVSIYIGDDMTDEDAFEELHSNGISIRVDENEEALTKADYLLRNPAEVSDLLWKLNNQFCSEERKWRVGH